MPFTCSLDCEPVVTSESAENGNTAEQTFDYGFYLPLMLNCNYKAKHGSSNCIFLCLYFSVMWFQSNSHLMISNHHEVVHNRWSLTVKCWFTTVRATKNVLSDQTSWLVTVLRAACRTTESCSTSIIICPFIRSHTQASDITESNLVFSVLLNNTSTCGLEKPGIKLLTLWLGDDPLYVLSHSRPHGGNYFDN